MYTSFSNTRTWYLKTPHPTNIIDQIWIAKIPEETVYAKR